MSAAPWASPASSCAPARCSTYTAACAPASDTRTRVLIDATLLEVGPWTFNLPLRTDGEGYVDWLLLDEELRITAGNKGSTFVHVRD